jgi:enterochelin esterase-like enzyme
MVFRKIALLISIILSVSSISGCIEDIPQTAGTSTSISTAEKTQVDSSTLLKITFDSKALNKKMKVNIYLPKGYSNQIKYPVLYMIHGYTGNQDSWMPGLEMEKKADGLINSNKIAPIIIVAPQIDNSYGINTIKDSSKSSSLNSLFDAGQYEDFLSKELISYIDKNYSTIQSREGRYIGGMSMGGWVALHMAFAHLDLFSKVGGHSPALLINSPGNAIAWVYPTKELRKERDPMQVAQDKDLKSLKIYLDCGKQDLRNEGCNSLYKILQSKGVDSQYHLSEGAHDGAYWSTNIEKYLIFYAGK